MLGPDEIDVSLPWWFGTHPYFRLSLGGGRPQDALIRFAAGKQWELANLIPTGKVIGVPEAADYAAGTLVGKREFDNAFCDLGIDAGDSAAGSGPMLPAYSGRAPSRRADHRSV